jgi:hypothetical protein
VIRRRPSRGPPRAVVSQTVAAIGLGALALGALVGARSTSWAQEPTKDAKAKSEVALEAPWKRREKCSECHSEQSWTKISEPDVAFDHSDTGFPLRDAHSKVACADCHRRGLSNLSQRCSACHMDPHAGANSQSCESCHNERSWDVPRNFFIHERTRFPLSGAHAAIACEACHRNARGEALAITPTECDQCHIRDRVVATPNHVAAGFLNCGQCHSTTTFRGASFTHRVYRLDGVHAVQSCTACHAGNTFAGLAAGGTNCLTCHQAQFNATAAIPSAPDHTVGPPFGPDCDRCHDNANPPVTFTGATFR